MTQMATGMTETAMPARDSSADLFERARRVMPGGIMATYAMPKEVARVMSHGDGSYIYDLEGNRYIDYVLGSGPLIVGHCHPHVTAALERQIGKGTQFYTLTQPVTEFCEALVD